MQLQTVEDYRGIVGDDVITEIRRLARPLYGKKILHINSTYYGGGVAEILCSLVPLLNSIGLEADWRIVRGTQEFFNNTKKIHNAIQGEAIPKNDIDFSLVHETNEQFAVYCKIDADAVIIHDPQPLPLIRFYKKRQPWIWRCHVDLSHPNEDVWHFLEGYVLSYDRLIVSDERYVRQDLSSHYTIINPAIDPLTVKNKPIDDDAAEQVLKKYGIPLDKPYITQISRYDKWKDPENVVEIYKMVRKQFDCRLILCGSMAADDPEGWEYYNRTRTAAGEFLESGEIILLSIEDNMLINALQTMAAVVIQKSIREGFGLTVTEALWKARPVVASNVGGIRRQIFHEKTGYLFDPADRQSFADAICFLLKNPDIGAELGARGKEHVRRNFLITRHIIDDLTLLNEILLLKKENQAT